jgi:S1-C subfamily serine protease
MYWQERSAIAVILLLLWLPFSGEVCAQFSPQGLQRLRQVTVLIESGSDRCSGVLISAGGLIATAAHGVHADAGAVRVHLANGLVQSAIILGRDESGDTALLRLQRAENSGDLVCVPLREPGREMLDGSVVFAAGFPARESIGSGAVLRTGLVKSAVANVVRTTCSLTVGDSGGPLLDGEGRLVGLHRRIGAGAESNLHTSLTSLRGLVQRASVKLTDLPAQSTSTAIVVGAGGGRPNGEIVRPLLASQLQVAMVDGGEVFGEQRLRGWLLTETLLALRLSAVEPGGEYAVTDRGKVRWRLKPVRQSFGLDLAIYELTKGINEVVGAAGVRPIEWREQPLQLFEQVHGVNGAGVGDEMLVSAGGLVSRLDWREPAVRAVLGAELEEFDEGEGQRLRVLRTVPNSPAALQLEAGDELRGVEGVGVESRVQFGELLRQRQPGDWLGLDVRRGGQQRRVKLKLGWDPAELFERSEYLDGRSGPVSDRRTGFVGVVQHDIPVIPDECPQLLVDWQGLPVGLTISRRARESSLAISARALLQLANAGLDSQ